VILGPTGGYLLSYPIAAFVTGLFAGQKGTFWKISLGMLSSTLIIYCDGKQLKERQLLDSPGTQS